MKQLLTILFFVPLMCNGQKDTTINVAGNVGFTMGFTPSAFLHISSHDTARCIMLVCDTSNQLQKHNGWLILDNVYWQFGYVVYEYSNYFGSDKTYYLDEKKKPLRKSIIVWDSRQIHYPQPHSLTADVPRIRNSKNDTG